MEGGRREINKKETVRREVMGSLETAKIGGCVNNWGGGGTAWTPSLPRSLPFKRFMLHLLTLPRINTKHINTFQPQTD